MGAQKTPTEITHGRHCTCSACAREDWTNPDLACCGMHGQDCPALYQPLGVAGGAHNHNSHNDLPGRPTPPRNGGPSPVSAADRLRADRAHGRHECDYCRRIDSDDEPASEWWYWQREGFWLCDDCYMP